MNENKIENENKRAFRALETESELKNDFENEK